MGIYKVKGKKGESWGIDFYDNGRRIKKIIGSKQDAEHALTLFKADSLRGELRMIKKNDMSFKELTEKYLDYGKTNGKRSLRRDRSSVKALMSHFKYLKISQVTSLLIEDYKRKRLEEKRKPGTVNRELSCLKHMLNLAKKWKLIHENLADDVKLLKEEKRPIRILSEVEAELLIDVAAEYLKPIILVALNTAMRQGEILSLKWDDIDFVRYNIHIREENSKSGKARNVPMNSLVAETLKKLKRNCEFVFENPRRCGKRIKDIYWSFKKALRESGIEKFRFHDLRHTAASWMVVKCGIDLVTVKEILGHSDIKITMIYCHASQDSKRRAVEGLEKIFSAKNIVRKQEEKFEEKSYSSL
ncbi:tyrosine-type recombinase/integrase [bacterium]|nr:tyrosine-type recombinase/integrase [bacterium]